MVLYLLYGIFVLIFKVVDPSESILCDLNLSFIKALNLDLNVLSAITHFSSVSIDAVSNSVSFSIVKNISLPKELTPTKGSSSLELSDNSPFGKVLIYRLGTFCMWFLKRLFLQESF